MRAVEDRSVRTEVSGALSQTARSRGSETRPTARGSAGERRVTRRVGIDLTYLFPGRALGHQRVCEGLVAGWGRLAGSGALDWEPVLLLSEEARPLFSSSAFASPPTGIRAVSATHRVLAQNVRLPQLCRRENLSLLYCPGNAAPLLAGLPTVVTLHDLHHRQYPTQYALARRSFFRLVAEPSLRRAARVVVPSKFTADQARQWLDLGSAVVPLSPQLPCDAPSGRPLRPAPPERPYFISVSATLPHKNVALLLRAFAAYRALGGGHSLALVGPHEVARGAEGVLVLDAVDDTELRHLFESASGFVSASEYEGFGLPLAEALAIGCPVLAPRLASIPETLGPDGHYFDSLQSDTMARDLLHFEHVDRPPPGAGNFGRRTWIEVAADYGAIFAEVIAQ